MISQEKCKAALIVVQKAVIAYPQVWLNKDKSKWNFDPSLDGLFIQLEADKGSSNISQQNPLRMVHYLPLRQVPLSLLSKSIITSVF